MRHSVPCETTPLFTRLTHPHASPVISALQVQLQDTLELASSLPALHLSQAVPYFGLLSPGSLVLTLLVSTWIFLVLSYTEDFFSHPQRLTLKMLHFS